MRFVSFLVVLFPSLCLAAEPAPVPTTAPSTQPTGPVVVTVRALIDGRDRLILKGMTARWQHFEWSAPGLHDGSYEPTTIDGIAWHPTWDNSDMDTEVRITHSMSSTFDGINPPIPTTEMTVKLEKVRCREDMSIVQQPSAENDYTTILEFDDNSTAGHDWYEAKLTFTPKP
jgi:hypothetical protein